MSPYITLYLFPLFIILITIITKQQIRLKFSNSQCTQCKSIDSVVFSITISLIGFMLAFRYGQGTDYFTYKDIFYLVKPIYIFSSGLHTEFGWKILSYSIQCIGLPFEVFVLAISIVEFFCLKSFIKNYCIGYKSLAFAMLYPTVIFSYMLNLMRQGLVMCIFLGYMLPLLEKQKYKKYVFLTFLTASLHQISITYLLLIPIMKKEWQINLRLLEIIKLFCALLSLSFGIINVENILSHSIPAFILHHANISFTYTSVIENIVIMLLMTVAYYKANNKADLHRYYLIFSAGVILFFLTSWITMFANRIFSLWKYVYIVFFIKYFIANKGITKQIALLFFICFSSFMLIRNIDVAIDQGNYISSVNAFNYPYMSIFDKSVAQKMRSDYR